MEGIVEGFVILSAHPRIVFLDSTVYYTRCTQ
jgi:hypothetical protein